MAEGTSERRALLFRVARWLVAVGLLAVVVSRVDLAALSGLFRQLSAGTVAQLGMLVVVQQLLLSERLHTVLRFAVDHGGAGPRTLTRLRVLGDWQVAAAYGAVLPSAIGGDVARYLLISRYLAPPDAPARALALLFVDRLIGLAALCTPPLVLTLWWGRTALGGAPAVVLVAGAVVLGLWQSPRVLQLLVRLLPTSLPRPRRFLFEVERGLRSVPAGPRVRMFFWSLAYQGCVGLFFEIAAGGWGLGPGLHEAVWVGLPTALALTVLPVSIGGLGLRESLFAVVFTASGLQAEHGVALALVWGAQGLGSAFLGAAVQGLRRDEP